MATLLLTASDNADGGGYLVSQPCRIRERLAARLHTWRLDRALAGGACPDESAPLSLRARRLIGHDARRALAAELRGVVRAAQRPQHPFDPGARVCVAEVLHARGALEALANQLEGFEPVDSRGVARVRLLLRDGAGPLYNEALSGNLERSVRRAFDALEPRA